MKKIIKRLKKLYNKIESNNIWTEIAKIKLYEAIEILERENNVRN